MFTSSSRRFISSSFRRVSRNFSYQQQQPKDVLDVNIFRGKNHVQWNRNTLFFLSGSMLIFSSQFHNVHINTECEAMDVVSQPVVAEKEQERKQSKDVQDIDDDEEEDWSDLPPIEDDDEEECPLCRFMKKSPCGNHFRRWQMCVDRYRESGDFAEKCASQTISLGKCSEKHDLGLFDLVGGEDENEKEANGDQSQSSS